MGRPAAQAVPQDHTLAIVSLVLGILGLVGILPVVGSVAAIITGNKATKVIKASPARYTGRRMARAGVALGWVGLVLVAAACGVILLNFRLFAGR